MRITTFFFRLAAEYDLELELRANFHEFYQAMIKNHENVALLRRMQAVDGNGRLSSEEWEVACM